MSISIVIPLYKCSQYVTELTKRIIETVNLLAINYEIILVNDCSPEGDWEIIEGLSKENQNIIAVSLSRNFGQQNAILAGLTYCNSDYIVIMDGDLQDKPEEIGNLYNKLLNGYDYVQARRKEKQFSYSKKMSSYLFYKTFGYLTDSKYDSAVGNFGIYKKKVIESYLNLGDFYRSFPIMLKWIGFNGSFVDVEHAARINSKSGYTLKKLFNLAFDSIVAHSNKLLYLSINMSLFLIVLSILFVLYIVTSYFFGLVKVPGYSSIIVTITFFTGCIMMVLGIIGVYIGKMFDTVKGRPSYIIKEVINR